MSDTLPPLPDLKPCPFCGSDNISTDDARDFLACMDCHTEGPCNIGMGSNYAIEAWNRRAAIAAHVPEAVAAVPASISVDELAQHIRWLNGNSKMGAGALAERLVEWLQSRAAPQAVPVPAGRVLVPVEPTIAMLCDAVKAWEGPAVYKVMSAAGLATLEEQAADAYRAMLAAAPKEQPHE